ncbi:unnamed protein product [Strongylus vulgaris]|uniref:Uncharacterized protein n=1 Tax=Strongylus vulgaris TaxID=40348 RepID=A0A3P7JCI5_STRVU|nr:unnamed protein product [Strongylus vulgaris]
MVLYTLSMLVEMVYYETIEVVTPNVVRIAVQGTLFFFLFISIDLVTIIGFAVVQRWLCATPQIEPARRKGRLFAKHYMEGNLLNPPDTDEVRELRKKQL